MITFVTYQLNVDFSLALKPADAVGITRELCGKDLDRSFTLQLGISGPVHFTHSALTEKGCYL